MIGTKWKQNKTKEKKMAKISRNLQLNDISVQAETETPPPLAGVIYMLKWSMQKSVYRWFKYVFFQH